MIETGAEDISAFFFAFKRDEPVFDGSAAFEAAQ
jgi:hypothetical protein